MSESACSSYLLVRGLLHAYASAISQQTNRLDLNPPSKHLPDAQYLPLARRWCGEYDRLTWLFALTCYQIRAMAGVAGDQSAWALSFRGALDQHDAWLVQHVAVQAAEQREHEEIAQRLAFHRAEAERLAQQLAQHEEEAQP